MLRQLETKRLSLRQITKDDFADLYPILSDTETMYAWEEGFTEAETKEYIDKNIVRYHRDGYSYLAVILKETNTFIGLCGPLKETIENKNFLGLGYIFKKEYWGKGYALEAATVCLEYCFHTLKAKEVIAEIRPDNNSSLNLAKKLGMKQKGQFVKQYKGKDMPHFILSITDKTYFKNKPGGGGKTGL